MTDAFTGRIASEIELRLRAALAPTHLVVTNDSARHHGHAGDDGSGESHFTVEIESEAFRERTRLECQRMVNVALRDLMRERVHALAIRAKAPDKVQSAGEGDKL